MSRQEATSATGLVESSLLLATHQRKCTRFLQSCGLDWSIHRPRQEELGIVVELTSL